MQINFTVPSKLRKCVVFVGANSVRPLEPLSVLNYSIIKQYHTKLCGAAFWYLYLFLFVSQSVDRVELCGFYGRDKSKHNAHHH